VTISTFNKHTIYKIQDLNLHDAEIAKITCDYNMHRIEIPVSYVGIIIAIKKQ